MLIFGTENPSVGAGEHYLVYTPLK